MARILSETVTADGNSTEITWKQSRKEAPNRATLWVIGTFDSGTVTLQSSPDGGTTFVDVPDAVGAAVAFTSDGMTNIELYGNQNPIPGEQVKLRLVLAGAGSPAITYIINGYN